MSEGRGHRAGTPTPRSKWHWGSPPAGRDLKAGKDRVRAYREASAAETSVYHRPSQSSVSQLVTPMPTVPPSNPLLLLCSPNPPVSKQRTSSPRAPPSTPSPASSRPYLYPLPLYSRAWWALWGLPGSRVQSRPPFRGGWHCRWRVMVPPQGSEHGDQGDQELHSPSTAGEGQDGVCVLGRRGFWGRARDQQPLFSPRSPGPAVPSPPAPPPRCPFPHPGRPL